MFNVTDAAFRAMVVKYSKSEGFRSSTSGSLEVELRNPLVLFTEFVSADGLASEAGRPKLLRELYYTEAERPIVAQIFGSNPATIEKAVKLIRELGFDGVDLNLGCPDRAVEKQGAGAALIKNPDLAREIILAAKRGAGKMPVSVKTRLGYNKIDYDWIRTVLEAKPDAVTFHLRTRKELSDAPAHWEEAGEIAKLAHEAGVVVIANGDVKSIEEGQELARKYNLDGIMIGRGAFGKPWLFADSGSRTWLREVRLPSSRPAEPDIAEKLNIMLEHSRLFWKLYDGNYTLTQGWPALSRKNFAVMRKHFKAYVSGFKGAMTLRAKLMMTKNPTEVEEIINEFLTY